MVIGGEDIAPATRSRRSSRTTAPCSPRPPGRRARGRARDRAAGGARTTGRACRGRSAPPSSCARPTCSPGRGARRSNAATMLGQSKTVHQAEIDAAVRADRLLALQRRLHDAHLRRAADLLAGRLEPDGVPAARGLRLRRHAVQLHGDRRQPPVERRADGQHGRLEAGLDRGLLGALRHAAVPGGGPAAGRDQPRLRRPARRSATRRSRATSSPACTSPGSTAVFHSMWRTVGANIGAVPQLPADRRRDRRQGLHRRASVGRRRTRSRPRSCAARSSTRGRSARRPRASTRRRTSGRSCASGSPSRSSESQMGDVADFSNFMGAVIDAKAFDEAPRGDRAGARARDAKIVVGGGVDDSRRAASSSRRSIETSDPDIRLIATALRPDPDRLRLPDANAGTRRSSSSTARRRTRSPARSSRDDREAIERAATTRCATRPGTSTSTTSRRAPSSASSPSAARARRARTTRPARCGT